MFTSLTSYPACCCCCCRQISFLAVSGTLPLQLYGLNVSMAVFGCTKLSGTILTTSNSNWTALNVQYEPLMSISPSPSSFYNTVSALTAIRLQFDSGMNFSLDPQLSLVQKLAYYTVNSMDLLTGTIPSQFGSTLTSLLTLSVSSDPLISGTVSTELAGLTSLTALRLENDPKLSGTFPSQYGLLTNLVFLNLQSDIFVSGTIPPELGKLTALRTVSFPARKLR